MADNTAPSVDGAPAPVRRNAKLAAASVFPLVAVGFAALFVVAMTGLREQARGFPTAVAIITALAALAVLALIWLRAGRQADAEEDDATEQAGSRRLAFWSYWLILIAWPGMISVLGFFTAAAVLGITLSMLTRPWDGRPSRRELLRALLASTLVTAAVVALTYVVTTVLLGIRFPHGLFV